MDANAEEAASHPLDFPGSAVAANLGDLANFGRGGPYDAQAFGASAGYANYVYGVYMAAAGYSLSEALSGANAYGDFFAHYSPSVLDPTSAYPSIPPVNVGNITAGFNAQQNGALCVAAQAAGQ